MFVTNWISTTKIQKISEITNFFRHYFLSRTEVYSKQNNHGNIQRHICTAAQIVKYEKTQRHISANKQKCGFESSC